MTEQVIVWNDLALARGALKDRRSEEALLRRVYPRIVQMVRLATGNRGPVDDIAQLAAMQVVKSLKSYRGEGSIDGWAGRIAWRTAARSFKRDHRHDAPLVPLLDCDAPSDETPEKSVSRRQLFDQLIARMGAIPEKRRVPFVLHLAYGYTVKEVSELLDISPNTVKDRLKTAIKEFQAIMAQEPGLMKTMLEELQ